MDVADLVPAGRMKARGPLRGAHRHPALHFAVLGALLFAGSGALRSERAPARETLVLGSARIERLAREYARESGLAPSPDDLRALVAREVDDELLYREALALGLDRDDRGVRFRLIEKMAFLTGDSAPEDSEALVEQARALGLDRDDAIVRRILIEQMRQRLKYAGSTQPPTDAELASWLAEHRDRFVQPARVRLSQVFLSREQRGPSLQRDAALLLERLRAGAAPPGAAAAFGDPLAMETDATSLTESELASRFGAAFAQAIVTLEPGTWTGPVTSPFGLHLVFVHERIPPREPDLAALRGNVLYALLAERREKFFDAGLRRLRERYEVRVEWPEAAAASPS